MVSILEKRMQSNRLKNYIYNTYLIEKNITMYEGRVITGGKITNSHFRKLTNVEEERRKKKIHSIVQCIM